MQCDEDVVVETVKARFLRKASGRRVGHRWTAQNFTMNGPNIVENLQIMTVNDGLATRYQ
jgi:hypothetical protein